MNAIISKAAVLLVGLLLLPSAARAATVSGYSDTMTRQKAGVAADHTILFVTPTGVDASSDTITLDFDSAASPTFTIGSVDFDDIDLAEDTGGGGGIGDCAGPFSDKALAASPGIGTWAASFSGNELTLTAPTDAIAGEIAPGACVQVEIGTNATEGSAGDDQIVNPASAGSYDLTLGGTFGDSGLAFIPINDDDQVAVTATVEADDDGGGGGTTPPPAAPVIQNVRAVNITETGADIRWDTNIAADSKVDYGLTVSYGSTQTETALVFNHDVALNGLQAGTEYHYRVRSQGSGTPEASSADFTFTTLDQTAPVLSNIEAVDVTGTTATITWDTNEDATSLVAYGTSPGPPYSNSEEDLTLTNAHSIDLTDLTPNTVYRYRVTSEDASGNSSTSVEFTFETSDTVPPVISNIQVVDITESGATVTWETNELADSEVDYGETDAYGQTAADGALVANHSIELSLLDAGTEYHFQVTSADSSGNAATSDDRTFTTVADTTPPANVSDFTVTPDDQQNALTWSNPGNTDFAGVRIQRSTSGFPSSPTSGTTVYDDSGTSFTDTGLTNGTEYFYTAFSYDESGNFSSGAIDSGTPFDTTPPGPVTNFTITPGDERNQLNWSNPADADYRRTRIQRSTSGFPSSPTSGTNIYLGSGTNVLDTGLTNGTTYYYSAFAEDTSGNFAPRAQASGTPSAPPPTCGDNICEDPETNASCPSDCPAPGPVCGDGTCEDPETNDSCPSDCPAPPPEEPVCGDDICESPETPSSCPADCEAPPPPGAVCGNGVCESGENFDSCPADCEAPPEPGQPPVAEPPVTSEEQVDRTQLVYLVLNRTLRLIRDEDGAFNVLPNRTLSVYVPGSALPKPVDSMVMNFDGNSYLFREIDGFTDPGTARATSPDLVESLTSLLTIRAASAQNSGPSYMTDVAVGADPGTKPGTIIIEYEDDTTDTVPLTVVINALGYVYETTDDGERRVSDASVRVEKEVNGEWADWDAESFSQINPQTTAGQGIYGFIAPTGRYRIAVSKDGYRARTTAPLTIQTGRDKGNVISQNIEIVSHPESITEVIVPGAPLTENIFNVGRNIGEQTEYITKIVRTEIVEDPRVKSTTRNIVVPAAAVVTTAVVATSIQAASFLSYIYYLVTQPILLLFRRKRKEFGVVFDALTKLPIDLAIVRLYRKNGKLVSARVTDKEGRYSFLVKPGAYKIMASKQDYIFPTEYMKGKKEGVKYLDIYHGETIEVSEEGAVITPNIPMDPIGVSASTKKLILGRIFRRLQDVLGVLSVILSLIAFLIYRDLFFGIMLAIQVGLFLLFWRLARPSRPKNWGIVYEEESGEPLPFAVARIIETEYGKVLESQVTDSKGRYNFLVGNNKYKVTFEKPGYGHKETDEIDLTTAKEGEAVISVDMGLEKESEEGRKKSERALAEAAKTERARKAAEHAKRGTERSDENELKRMYMEKMGGKVESSKSLGTKEAKDEEEGEN